MAFTVEDPNNEIVPQFINSVGISVAQGGVQDGEVTIEFKFVYQKCLDRVTDNGTVPGNERETRTKTMSSVIMRKEMAVLLRDILDKAIKDTGMDNR